MKTIKIIGIVVVAALVIWGPSSLGGNKPTVGSEPIKVGVILPLTGDLGFLGEEIKKGMDLALVEINSTGQKLEVKYEDDAFDPAKSASAANKLISIDKVDIGATVLIEEARPIIKIFSDGEVPLVILWDSNRFIQESGKYIFSNGFSTEAAGEDMAEYAYNKLGLRRVAILAHIDAWAEVITTSFKSRFQQLGGQIVSEEAVDMGTSDYRTLIAKLNTTKPDGIYFPMVPPQNAQFLKQLNNLKINATLLTGDALIQDSITEAGPAAEGVYFTNYYADDPANLSAKYKTNFETDPIDPALVYFGYDGMIKLAEAVKQSDDEVITGLNKEFGPLRTANRKERIFKVVNGVPVEVK